MSINKDSSVSLVFALQPVSFDINVLNIASINLQGKYLVNKREIQSLFEDFKMDVVAMQDLGLTERESQNKHFNLDKLGMNYKFIMCSDNTKNISIGIIWNKILFKEVPKIKWNEKMRFIYVLWKQQKIAIINVYISGKQIKSEQINSLNTLIKKLIGKNIKVIVMGDFNENPNNSLNKWSNKALSSTTNYTKFIDSLKGLDFVDAFRSLHPFSKKFTRVAVENLLINNEVVIKHIATRIDHIFIESQLTETLINCTIWEDKHFDSDHKLISATFNLDTGDKFIITDCKQFKRFRVKKLLYP